MPRVANAIARDITAVDDKIERLETILTLAKKTRERLYRELEEVLPGGLEAGGYVHHVTVTPEAKQRLIDEHGLSEDHFYTDTGGDDLPSSE